MQHNACFRPEPSLTLALMMQALPAEQRQLYPSDGGAALAASCALTRTGWPLTPVQAIVSEGQQTLRLYAPTLTLAGLDSLLAGLRWHRLRWLNGDVYELSVPILPDKALYQSRAEALAVELIAGPFPSLREPGLLVMDMDSTAICGECIDDIAELAGCGEAVAQVTARAMRGELDFAESLRLRVAKLAGTPATVLEQVANNLHYTPGIPALVARLQQAGWQTALVSGGFTFFAHRLQQQLGLSLAEANVLEIIDGKLTGQILGQIVDGDYKKMTLERLRDAAVLPARQVLALGDGANDVPMLQAAGMGLAYHGKPAVRLATSGALVHYHAEALLAMLDVEGHHG